MTTTDPVVLVVDDSETDVLLMRTVFERSGFVLPLQFARDGMEAIAYLDGEGHYSDRIRFPLPTVMLLDLNMPRKNGFEVLEWVRQQPAFKRLRIYVLSASSRPEDIRRAYDLGANSYLVKPGNLDALMKMAKILVDWLRSSHFAPLVEITRNHESAPAPAFTPRPDTSPATSIPPLAAETDKSPSSIRELAWTEVYRRNEDLELRFKKQTAELNLLRIDQENIIRLIGHDVRTPLMTIGGFTDLLLQGSDFQLDDKSRLYLLKITEATDKLTRMLAAIVAGEKVTLQSRLSPQTGMEKTSAA